MRRIYRLTLDENGEEEISDYGTMDEAFTDFNKAVKRKSVFSARVDVYNEDTHELLSSKCLHFEAI